MHVDVLGPRHLSWRYFSSMSAGIGSGWSGISTGFGASGETIGSGDSVGLLSSSRVTDVAPAASSEASAETCADEAEENEAAASSDLAPSSFGAFSGFLPIGFCFSDEAWELGEAYWLKKIFHRVFLIRTFKFHWLFRPPRQNNKRWIFRDAKHLHGCRLFISNLCEVHIPQVFHCEHLDKCACCSLFAKQYGFAGLIVAVKEVGNPLVRNLFDIVGNCGLHSIDDAICCARTLVVFHNRLSWFL